MELRGQREHVAAEIKTNPDLSDAWKAALLESVAEFMPEFNGVRVDAHAHQVAIKVPLPPTEIVKNKDKNAPTERTTGGMVNFHISISAVKLSAGQPVA